jgi:hypothetical protein
MTDKITINVGDTQHNLTFFKSINELPIKRFQLVQRYCLIESGIGSTLNDVLRHFSRLDQFIEVKDFDSIVAERENLLMAFQFMMGEEYIKSYVFASLIKSVDGVNVDITDDNIDDYVQMLENSDLTISQVEDITDSQKKSLMSNSH